MTDPDRTAALGTLQIAVTALSRQLGAVEHLTTAGLEELKHAVDDVRLRLWSVLMAANAADGHGYLERFRLRRTAEIVRGLVTDVDAGTLRLAHREASDLAYAMRELSRRLEKIPKVV